MLTQQRLKEVVSYDKDSGLFTRISNGESFGHYHSKGYLHASVDSKKYLLHRLAWLYVYGYMPSVVDHINRDPKDNRIANLRQVTNSQNQMNRGVQSNSTTGLKGVYWVKSHGLYRAQIKRQGKINYLGYFTDKYDAYSAYTKAADTLHKEFACYE